MPEFKPEKTDADICFNHEFGAYQSQLRGTEAEIVAMKQIARMWFDAGRRSMVETMQRKVRDLAQDLSDVREQQL